jgi:hypothetical protein
MHPLCKGASFQTKELIKEYAIIFVWGTILCVSGVPNIFAPDSFNIMKLSRNRQPLQHLHAFQTV